jgi:signal recognition particle subunit SRP54
MAQMFGGPGGMGGGQMPNIPGVSQADMEKAQQMLAENGGKIPGLGGGGLPGLGGGLPGFPFKKP